MPRRKIIAGNWKMYKTIAEAVGFAYEFVAGAERVGHEIVICAPFTQLAPLKRAFSGSDVKLGAQNMHFADEGAYTGEISPAMLAEIGVDYCVIGHSERRQYFAETDGTVNQKLKAAFARGISPIVCVGEVLEERDAGKAFDVVKRQLEAGLSGVARSDAERLVVAYEPVWAIGTGRTATPEQAEEMCAFIRQTVGGLYDDGAAERVRIQYGGSVKPSNARELLTKADIDGALVGGASLSPADFKAIVEFDRRTNPGN
ncbi:MAG: triose-phosphate isomerase [Clostridiales Family XIII bacterium]|jgi:triosephosphate isomerase|nr:triose-phosphate isomerase [Clostridiales Family XIII bacterium]